MQTLESIITIKDIKNFKNEKRSLIIATNDQSIIDISDILIDLNSKPKPQVVKNKK